MSMSLHDTRVELALSRIRLDGVLTPADDIVETVERPHWERAMFAHDWRRHVPPALREIWSTLPLHTRLCVFESAEFSAMEEDATSVMVTGPGADLP
jgi:hypothetical protein